MKDAAERYIEEEKYGSSNAAIQNCRVRLKRFIQFCERAGITDVSKVRERTLKNYKMGCVNCSNLNAVSLEQYLRTTYQFLVWCGVEEEVAETVTVSPSYPMPPSGLRRELGRTS